MIYGLYMEVINHLGFVGPAHPGILQWSLTIYPQIIQVIIPL